MLNEQEIVFAVLALDTQLHCIDWQREMYTCESLSYTIRSACTRYSTCFYSLLFLLFQMTAVNTDGVTHRSPGLGLALC